MDSNAPTQVKPTGDDLFNVGDTVSWKDHVGAVKFICERYITICVKTYPNDDPNALSQEREVCLLCFNDYWKDVQVLNNK